MEEASTSNARTTNDETKNDTNEQNPPAETESNGTEISLHDETEKEKKTEIRPKHSPILGIFLCIMAALAVVMARTIFIYFKEVNVFLMNAYANVVMTVFTLPLNCIFLKKEDLTAAKNMKLMLFIMGILAGFTTIATRVPLMHIPFGTVSTIFYLRPILVMFFAYFLIDEKLGWTRILFAILVLIGVCMVLEPPFIFTYAAKNPHGPWWAYAIAFSQPVINTFAVIFLRLTKDIHFIISTTTCSFITTFVSICFIPLADKIELPNKWILYVAIIAIGFLTTLSGLASVLAHHFCDAGVLSTVRSVELVFSFVVQVTIFKEIPTTVAVIGACIVVLSVSGMGLSEYLETRKKKKMAEVDLPIIENASLTTTSISTIE